MKREIIIAAMMISLSILIVGSMLYMGLTSDTEFFYNVASFIFLIAGLSFIILLIRVLIDTFSEKEAK